jgi:hypothetical protein
MTDIYGGLALPAVAGEFAGKALDPALDAITSYLQAVLPVRLGAAWASVAPREDIVRTVCTVNPRDCLVAPQMLPALFVWRGPAQMTREAEDYLITRTQLGCTWLLWWDEPLKRERRLPFQGAIVKAIHESLCRGRHPAWVVPGDTTRGAATRGSVLQQQAGLLEPFGAMSAAEIDIMLEQKGGTAVAYKALSLTIPIAERMERDPTLFTVPTISTSDPQNGNVGTDIEPAALDLTVLQSPDNTTEQLKPQP